MARAVIILSAEDNFQFQASPRRICGGTFSNRTSLPLCIGYPVSASFQKLSLLTFVSFILCNTVHSKLLVTPAIAQFFNLCISSVTELLHVLTFCRNMHLLVLPEVWICVCVWVCVCVCMYCVCMYVCIFFLVKHAPLQLGNTTCCFVQC